MTAPPPQGPPNAPFSPVQAPASQPPSPAANQPAVADLDLESLGRSKGVSVGLTIGASLGTLVVGVLLGALLFSGGSAQPAEQPSASAMASASAAPPPEPEPPPKTQTELAVEGDEAAIKALEAKTPRERTAAETLALFRSEPAVKDKKLQEMARKIKLVKAFGESEDTKKKIMGFVQDDYFSVRALEILAELPGPIGPDYLYKVSTMGGRSYKETRQLAEDLLLSKDVYEKASDALKITLELQATVSAEEKDCSKALKNLKTAQADADQRIFRWINKLNSKRGCGSTKLEDCWKCLRDKDNKKALSDAISLARKNKPPL